MLLILPHTKKSAMQQVITRGADWLEIIGAWANACVTNPHDFLEVKILYFAFNVVRMLSIATLSSCDLLCSCFDILTQRLDSGLNKEETSFV